MKKIYYLGTAFLTMLLLGVTLNSTAAVTVTLVKPNASGIVWITGNTYNITWTIDQPQRMVDVYLSTTQDVSGTLGNDLWQLFDNVASGTTSKEWTINPTQTLGDYYIVIANRNNTNVYGASANSFEITDTPPAGTGTIHVNKPNVAGIQWEPGTTNTIYWSEDVIEPVKLELFTSTDGVNFTEYTDATGLPSNVEEGTSYDWVIDATIPEGNQYYIKVMSTTTDVFDFGDNPFAITTTFSGGTEVNMLQPDVDGLQWESGTTHLVSWIDDLIENVNLILYIEDPDNAGAFEEYKDGAPGYTVPSALPTDESGSTIPWEIPATLPNGNYKIYAESSVTSSINNFSEYPFEITDTPTGGSTIILIQPEEAGIQWVFGGEYLISWNDDVVEPVDVQLHNTDGSLYTIDSDVSGSTLWWTIPAVGVNGIDDDDDYRIRIFSQANPTIEAISTNPFKITATPSGGTNVNIIQPSIAGLEWQLGTGHLISWTDDLLENVKIQLWIDGGDEIITATAGLSEAQDLDETTWTWDIPSSGIDPGDYVIKVVSTASSTSGVSEHPFKIIDYSPYGEVIMIQPNGGEEWIVGNSYLISWTDNISENVEVFVTDNWNAGSPNFTKLTPVGGVEGSTWTWNTNTATGGTWPYGTTTGTDFYMKVSSINTSSTAEDISEAPFSFVQTIGGEVLVIQPNGGEVWIDETTYIISWTDELAENVYIKLYDYTTPTAPDLIPESISGLPASGDGVDDSTYEWDIPVTVTSGTGLYAGTDYRIKVESIWDATYSDVSDGDFEIAAEQTGGSYVHVIQPNGGEEWELDTEHLISWNDDVYEDLNVDLCDANGAFVQSIVAGSGETTYPWTIDSDVFDAGTYKIRVYSPLDESLEDYSDAVFTIVIPTKEGQSSFTLDSGIGELAIYPNPTSTEFTVAAPGSIDRVEVRNLLGQVLYSSNVDTGKTVIDISNYDVGVYIVNIIVEGEVVTQKLFVQ